MKVVFVKVIPVFLSLLFIGLGCTNVSLHKPQDVLEKDASSDQENVSVQEEKEKVSDFDPENPPRDYIPSPGEIIASLISNDTLWKAETIINDHDDQVLIITGPETKLEFGGALPVSFSPSNKTLVFCYHPKLLSGLFVLPLLQGAVSIQVTNIFPKYTGGRFPEDYVPCPQPGKVTWKNDVMVYSIDGKQYELDTVTLVHRQRK